MVFYCPHCKKLYDRSQYNCSICGSLLSFDSVRSRSVFLSEGYEEFRSGGNAEQPAPPTKTVTPDAPVKTVQDNKVEPPRRKKAAPAPPVKTVMEKKHDEHPRRTDIDPLSGKSVTEKKPSEPPRAVGGSIPPVPPPGFIFDEENRTEGWGSNPPVPPPGFSGGGDFPPRRDDGSGDPPSHSPVPPASENQANHFGRVPTPPSCFSAAAGGRGSMPDPQAPNYGSRPHVDDGGSGEGAERPVWGRILLILLLLALVGFVLYMIISIRSQIAGKLSNVVFGIIVVAAILLYLKRRR